ncbi:MAG: hypothetical protein PHP32_07760, partial [Candidatus Izemoplasmatales bacterium]|nr:hypothetical protein [Candidatus Izemoplasmatales bacterium]
VMTIVPGTFTYTDLPALPFWRIFTAPFEVLGATGNALVIAIILFLLIIGGSIKVLQDVGIIEYVIHKIVNRFQTRKYLLLGLITLSFMSLGAFIGVFEEIVPLVPIIVILAKKLGWDTKIGLGMSVLAAGFGFSAAITNPFTIGVAQQLASLPLFSGFLYRMIIFVVTYGILYGFLYLSAKRVEQTTTETNLDFTSKEPSPKALRWVMIWFSLMLLNIVLSPFVSFFQDYNMILIAFYFLIAGIGAALFGFEKKSKGLKTYLDGSLGMAPGVILILLASGVRHLITIGGIMDTILFRLVSAVEGGQAFTVVLGAFFFTLAANFFIGSGSAKAFLIIPILDPLFDLSGISRQLGVLAFQLGDGFSNMLYPTNAVLLVSLGLVGFAYPKWFKWTILLQIGIILLSILFLFLGLQVGY